MADTDKDINTTDEFEPDIIELDGEQFEIIDAMEHEGANYFALIPYTEDEELDDEDELEFIVLQEIEENGEYFLSTIDDEDEADIIGDLFLKRFDELPDLDELEQ